MRDTQSGFTLIELLVTAAASLILVGAAFSGLLAFQSMTNKVDGKLTQEAKLNRALRFISRDIQEGKSVEKGAPELSGYKGLFKIVLPDAKDPIGYYTIRKKASHVWLGPQIIYRKDFRPDKDGKVEQAYALIDQVSDQEPKGCPSSSDLVKTGVGFSVIISQNTRATICIASQYSGSSEVMEGSIEATVRALKSSN